MYTSFFGLNEKPFSITPDPRYLFLSERHAEALAHLLYGVTESGGFIQLTGEVGTGKTTVVRSLLEKMPEHTEFALVLNPRLTAHEFLVAICEELRLPLTQEERRSDKEIVDALNLRLLQAHAQGHRVVLIVDEAQNLSPEVLEQIRLLTNLETAKQKLLQIILIGQPELREVLARTDLRQLAQRVTGRYHLEPLDPAETRSYMRHRLQVAGGSGEIFSGSAMRAIHRSARGVPRLINVICDRALLGAFSREQRRVSRRLARIAASEVSGEAGVNSLPWLIGAGSLAIVGAAALFVINLMHGDAAGDQSTVDLMPQPATGRIVQTQAPIPDSLPGLKEPELRTPPGQPASQPEPESAPQPEAEPGPQSEPEPELTEGLATEAPVYPEDISLEQRLLAAAATTDTDSAFATLMILWSLDYARGASRPCDTAAGAGLRCLFQRGSWGQLLTLNRPAILSLVTDDGNRHQVVLSGTTGQGDPILLIDGDETVVRLAELVTFWMGDYLLIWRPARGDGRTLSPGTTGGDVSWLRDGLSAVLERPLVSPRPEFYDDALTSAVRQFQADRRLHPDGVAGSRTLITLNTALALPDRPHLQAGS